MAQKFTASQMADLRALFAAAGEGAIPGSWLADGAVTPAKLDRTYLELEVDPVFSLSVAAGITAAMLANWNAAYGWGDHALSGYLTLATVPVLRKTVLTAVGGETLVALAPAPLAGSAVNVTKDVGGVSGGGLMLLEGADYVVAAGVVTLTLPLGAGDVVQVIYYG